LGDSSWGFGASGSHSTDEHVAGEAGQLEEGFADVFENLALEAPSLADLFFGGQRFFDATRLTTRLRNEV
jgi:hypothetical protein